MDTRERILRAAIELFAVRGYERTSVREIIAAAGVANGAAVGYYFGDKYSLYEAVVERCFDSLITAVSTNFDRIRSTPEPIDMDDLIAAYVRPMIEFTNSESGWSSVRILVHRMASGLPMMAGPGVVALEKLIDEYVELYRVALPDLPETEIRWRFEAMNGVVASYVQATYRQTRDEEEIELAVSRLVAFCRAGFESRAATNPGSLI